MGARLQRRPRIVPVVACTTAGLSVSVAHARDARFPRAPTRILPQPDKSSDPMSSGGRSTGGGDVMDDGRVGLEIARDRMLGRHVHDALASTQVLGLVMSLRCRMGDELMAEVTGISVAALDEWCDGWLD